MTDDIARLEASLEADPYDWDLRLILADAYEEAGDSGRGRYLRWSSALKKCPVKPKEWRNRMDDICWFCTHGGKWEPTWAIGRFYTRAGGRYPSVLKAERALQAVFEREGYPGSVEELR